MTAKVLLPQLDGDRAYEYFVSVFFWLGLDFLFSRLASLLLIVTAEVLLPQLDGDRVY